MPITAREYVNAKWTTIEAALCLSAGLDDVEKHFDDMTLNAAAKEYRHGISFRDVLILAANENGGLGCTRHDVKGLFEAAFIRAYGFSTMSLPGVLSNVANKFLAVGFNAVENGWREIAARRSTNDFKQITSYSLTGDMLYEKVGPTGELKHAQVGELKYTNQVDTYGKLFTVTRTDIVNDDIGAFTQVPQKLGRGAALKLNAIFWNTFLAGVGSFFASGNANVITGGTSVLSAAALGLAQTKFRKQTDADGEPLGVSPKILLVPPELEISAEQLVNSTAFNTGGSSTTDQVPNRNPFAGKFKVISASYLSNANYTGYSTTAWYLLADPMDLPTIEVAFLNGRDTPTIESADADFGSLGIQFRGLHDFGCALQEYRAGMRAAGA